MRARLVLLAAWLLVALTPASASAHAGNYDMKYIDGSNVILLTFNTHLPVAGLDIVHDIRLYDLVGAPIPYDQVKVEVHTRANTSGLALPGRTLLQDFTLPMLPTNESKLTYAYPGSGSYTLKTVFLQDGREISRGDFALDIGRGAPGSSPGGTSWVKLSIAFLLGLGVHHAASRRRRRATPTEAGEVAEPVNA
jgi:hypothetical protein